MDRFLPCFVMTVAGLAAACTCEPDPDHAAPAKQAAEPVELEVNVGLVGQTPPGEATEEAAGHYGKPFELEQTQPLAKALAEATNAEEVDGVVKVQGTVESVCQRRGCWLVLEDGEHTARIFTKDHGFAVPTDSRGRSAVVEGALSERTLSVEQVKHLEADRGGDPDAVADERTEYVITATAVAIEPEL